MITDAENKKARSDDENQKEQLEKEESRQTDAPEETAEKEEKAAEDTEAEKEEKKGTGELDILKKDYAVLNDRFLRTVAEYDNFRKRTQKEKEQIYSDAAASVSKQFLPVLDNLERALEYECSDNEFKKGVEMIATSIRTAFEKCGIKTVGEVGEPFDPNIHNAVMHEENNDLPENAVSMVLQKGYILGDKLLRPAMVKVAN